VQQSKVYTSIQNEETITTDLIIGCDGAYSTVKKYLFSATKQNNPAVAIRAYFNNLNVEPNANYFYVNNKIAKSYLWIFPVTNNLFNVGFGIIPTNKNKSIDVKKAFSNLLDTDKNIQHIFENVLPETKVEGFKLPLYNGKINISTDHCMLCGDAANLIDPIQGHGIDKAMESGRLAAMQAIQCFTEKKFNASFLKAYDQAVYHSIGKELQRNKIILNTLARLPWLLDLVAAVSKTKAMQWCLKKLS
jgi:menaquinone-9 beta-reductase